MKHKLLKSSFVAATLFAAAGIASAAVTFDFDTGTGFVGKGDVQLAFGWNNAQLQQNADAVSFTYKATDTYTATCTWVTGEGTKGEKTHNVPHTKSIGVDSSIAYEARKNKKEDITGFILNGFNDDYAESGEVPVVGGSCQGEGAGGLWSSVRQTGSSEGLYATFGSSSKLIYGTE